MKHLSIAIAALACLAAAPAPAGQNSDAAIRQRIIRQSIASYPGSCPCPYSTARNGSSCGGRSAWSRKGGYGPKCYARDISDAEVRAHRR